MKTENTFPYSDTNKRYHTYDYAMKKRFGGKIARLCLDVGMTCPNIDGKISSGGCAFCVSSDDKLVKRESVTEQLLNGITKLHKWPAIGYIAYFQAHTNTYAPTETLRTLYAEALAIPGVVGLAIATRPDCLSNSTCDLLKELSKQTYLTVELGLQTIHDETALRLNRGHTLEQFLRGYEKLVNRGILVGVHLIDGLPDETPEMMLASAQKVGKLSPHLVKLHMLYVARETTLANWYLDGKYTSMSRTEFVDIICNQLEVLPPETIIGRLTGDGESENLLAPQWSLKKLCVLNEIDKEQARRDSFQGKINFA